MQAQSLLLIRLNEQSMDTDYLTEMAYDTLRLADSITRDLTLELGVISKDYRSEDEYLKGMLEVVRDIKRHAFEFLEENELENKIPLKKFRSSLSQLEKHIKNTLQVPIEKRGLRS
jgi:hypothetical protein